MSHHIYQTRAFIIDSSDTGEANKFIAMFTEDLGLIYVAAQGVRLVQSKLRPFIQEMSFSKVSLVRGRELWRLTSAEKLISLADRRIPMALRKVSAEILQFVRRLVQGEEKHDALFSYTLEFFEFLLKKSAFSSAHIAGLTALGKASILHELGYGSHDTLMMELCGTSASNGTNDTHDTHGAHVAEGTKHRITEEKILAAEKSLRELEMHIRIALESSHL